MWKVLWRIWFADNTYYDSTMGKPWQSPNKGVVVVTCLDDMPHEANIGFVPLSGWDWYYYKFDPERRDFYWSGCDFLSLGWYATEYGNLIPCWRRGETVRTRQWHTIHERARNDSDFPPKQGERYAGQGRRL